MYNIYPRDIDCGLLADGPRITFGDDVAVAGVIDYGDDGLICRTQDTNLLQMSAPLDMFSNI